MRFDREFVVSNLHEMADRYDNKELSNIAYLLQTYSGMHSFFLMLILYYYFLISRSLNWFDCARYCDCNRGIVECPLLTSED